MEAAEVLGDQQQGRLPSHPFAAPIGGSTYNILSTDIQRSEVPDVTWNGPNYSSPSSMGMVQIDSEKSQRTLKDSSFKSYPVHMTLLNFDDSMRKNLIMTGKNIVGYLPVSFYESPNSSNAFCSSGLSR